MIKLFDVLIWYLFSWRWDKKLKEDTLLRNLLIAYLKKIGDKDEIHNN